MSRTLLSDAVQKLHERGVPLKLLAISRLKKNLSKHIVADGRRRAFHILHTSRRTTHKIMKRGIAKARTWIINKVRRCCPTPFAHARSVHPLTVAARWWRDLGPSHVRTGPGGSQVPRVAAQAAATAAVRA